MIVDSIRERLKREPFEPFIIRSSRGEAVKVASPDLAVMMKSEIFIAAPNSDRWAQIPYLHVAGIESANGNGGHRQRRKRT